MFLLMRWWTRAALSEEGVPFESAAGVAVQVDHAGHQLAGTDDRLVETALKFKFLLVYELDVPPLDLEAS